MSYKSFCIMLILGIIANIINYIITRDILSIIVCVVCLLILFNMEHGK